MGVEARLEEVSGNLIAHCPDTEGLFSDLLATCDLGQTSCLRFIDPQGETAFNARQIPVLIEELTGVIASCAAAADERTLRRVTAFARRAQVQPELRLTFRCG